MESEIVRIIREYSSNSRIRFKKHALIRIIERNIKINEIEETSQNCKIIESYTEDQPFISYLILGFTNDNRPLHIVVAIDNFEKYIWIISVYEPSRNKWDETFSKRIVK
jgi:hypothetical protein